MFKNLIAVCLLFTLCGSQAIAQRIAYVDVTAILESLPECQVIFDPV